VGLSAVLGRLAAGAPVPVFAIAGAGAREAVQDLRLRPELRVLDAPGPAAILLIAGELPEVAAQPLGRIHDALAHPRATVLWSVHRQAHPALDGVVHPVVVDGDPVAAIISTFRDLVAGRRATEPAVLHDVEPAPWRGLGPYGQGGSGMTGGTPYGRPMAELGPDPDGLRLDVLPVDVGPFFPRFPTGLVLDAKFAGDVLLEAGIMDSFADGRVPTARPGLQPFLRALKEPVPIAELELARARDHLRWLADALRAQGLSALGLRALRFASAALPGDGRVVERLRGVVERSQVLRWSVGGVGRTGRDDLAGLGAGPVARAAGLAEDLRSDDSVYLALGFKPILGDRGDAAARWRLRLGEAAQSLELAARAGLARTGQVGRVESPRGRLETADGPSERMLAVVPGLIRETEWGDAVATLVSLDLDLEESALARHGQPAEAIA
jgi:hypothetical protein